jgi:hypothetical protein
MPYPRQPQLLTEPRPPFRAIHSKGREDEAIYHGIRDVRVEEVEEPKRGPGEAKLRVV